MNDLTIPDTQMALLKASENRNASAARDLTSVKNIEKIDEAAQEFEAMFVSEMLKPMFEGVMEPDPMFGGGKGEEIFKSLMLDEYGKLIAKSGGIGIAEQVKAEMIRIQEANQK
ncbi:MAG: rod-binding protein [Alphaproteobacteria bacterium]|nr:rod-binding protein [Alphaproteobacteria bacterium]